MFWWDWKWFYSCKILLARVVGGFVGEVKWVEGQGLSLGGFGVRYLKDAVQLHVRSIQAD